MESMHWSRVGQWRRLRCWAQSPACNNMVAASEARWVSGWLTGAAAEQDEPGGKGGGQGHELGDDDGKDGQHGVLAHKAQQDGHRVGGALHSVEAGPGEKARAPELLVQKTFLRSIQMTALQV